MTKPGGGVETVNLTASTSSVTADLRKAFPMVNAISTLEEFGLSEVFILGKEGGGGDKLTRYFRGNGAVPWSVFVHCTIPESMDACFLVVLGGGGGGVLLGRGGGMCL